MSTPDPVAGLVRLLNIVGPQPISTADALRPQLGNLNTGDYVPAHVLASLPNGRFHVLVKDQLLDLNLPPNTEPGETLELRVERNDGRLQFSLQNQPAPQAPPPQGGVNLSSAARLLQEALQRTQTQEPARVSGTEPLIEGQPEAGPLADNLRQAVRESGLFYESHQQQWASGNKPLAELLREPQARLGGGPVLEARDSPIDPKQLATLLQALQEASPDELPQVLKQLASQLRQEPGSEGARQPAAHDVAAASGKADASHGDDLAGLARQLQRNDAVPSQVAARLLQDASPQTAPDDARQPPSGPDLARVLARHDMQNMVQQQIQALETHHLLWQGQVWPGQNMDWEIVGERNDGQAGGEAAPTHWTSRLALELPNLGRVVAHVQLSQGQVSLKLAAAEEGTASAFREQQSRLLRQFEAADLTLASTTIVRGIDEEVADGK